MTTTTPLHITLDHARDAISQIVDEFGEDHRYERPTTANGEPTGCWNVWDGKASCLVGRALILIGVPLKWFTEGPNPAITDARCGAGIDYLAKIAKQGGSWTITEDALDYFARCQTKQDNGETWGAARAYAEAFMPKVATTV